MEKQPLSAEYHVGITSALLQEVKRSVQSDADSKWRTKQVVIGMNRAMRDRLLSAIIPVVIGAAIYFFAIFYFGSPNVFKPEYMLAKVIKWLGMVLVATGPALALRAIVLRFLLRPRRLRTPQAVAETFYREIFSGDVDWGKAFSCLGPKSASELSPPSVEGLKRIWEKELHFVKLRVRRALGPPVRCGHCGKEANLKGRSGYPVDKASRSAEFQETTPTRFLSEDTGEWKEAPLGEICKQAHFYRCSNCQLILCGECFAHEQPDDRCSKCGVSFNEKPYEILFVLRGDAEQLESGWRCTGISVSTTLLSEDTAELKADVHLDYSRKDYGDHFTGTGVVRFNNGAVRFRDQWLLVSGVPGNLKT